MDDKGLVLIFAFGAPGSHHADGTARALQCALTVVRDVRAAVRSSSATVHHRAGDDGTYVSTLPSEKEIVAGLASGPVFCGRIGSSDRCEVNRFFKVTHLIYMALAMT